ncbi:MAG TPA: hypothetical protein ENI41_06030 [Deltaproteobacteria bacterium]|nr:hypothetical protein [Deltaproteobacteria bacterium]
MFFVEVDSLIHFALWEQLPEGHPIKELWLESQTDLFATIYLAYGGFFRRALTVLRAWFEIAVHGVYFSFHYGQPSERYEQWRRGERNAPARMEDITKSLEAKLDNTFQSIEHSRIYQKLKPIYAFLSKQTHAQGLDVYALQDGRDNVPRFLEHSFNLWYEMVFEAFDAVIFLYRIFFTPVIREYLCANPAEKERSCDFAEQMGALLPEFCSLIQDISHCEMGRKV